MKNYCDRVLCHMCGAVGKHFWWCLTIRKCDQRQPKEEEWRK